jgi:hypothetical protein
MTPAHFITVDARPTVARQLMHEAWAVAEILETLAAKAEWLETRFESRAIDDTHTFADQ